MGIIYMLMRRDGLNPTVVAIGSFRFVLCVLDCRIVGIASDWPDWLSKDQ